MAQLTAVVIARDAERTISDCVRSLAFCNLVLVGENGSSDQTARLARQAGAQVRSVAWLGYGPTKNLLIQAAGKGWIVSVDADEIITPALAAEILHVIADPRAADGYWISRRNFFMGREIRHSGWSPDWQLRLFKAGRGRFAERPVHEALQVTGRVGRLANALEHYSYPDLSAYLRRMNLYTSLAAKERQAQGRGFSHLRLFLDPPWVFFKMFFLKQGWRDGFPGFVLCALSALHSMVKHAKHWETRQAIRE